MSVERRGQVIRVPITLVNWQEEESTDRGEGRQLFMDDTSRASREAQGRFCDGLGVQFPGATRPSATLRDEILSRAARSVDAKLNRWYWKRLGSLENSGCSAHQEGSSGHLSCRTPLRP